ncbi:MAG: DNA polymerase IV [Gemmatimonadetes bacterium]|nr:DNA polymerase IV [Gemmatimonadota bacterium]
MNPRCIAHVDMDAFYVSVELERRPELRGRPVVVAGSGPRAVVTTASYEARKFGVFSATPAARARRRCPEAVFVEPDFATYRARSADVMAVLREHVERVEVMGLDEAYLDLTDLPQPQAAARAVKHAVRERTGLVCSVGIGPSKLVAKVASDAGKPDGFLVLTAAEARARFADAPPGCIPGIGPKTAAKLDRMGIGTVAALAATADDRLVDPFGPRLGPWLGALARFEDDDPVEPVRVAKSESRETTFDSDLNGLEALEPALTALCDDLCAALRDSGRRGRTIGIKIRLNDFSTHTRARTIEGATHDVTVVRGIACELLRSFDPQRPVRLLGVRVAGLEDVVADCRDRGGEPQEQLKLPPPMV